MAGKGFGLPDGDYLFIGYKRDNRLKGVMAFRYMRHCNQFHIDFFQADHPMIGIAIVRDLEKMVYMMGATTYWVAVKKLDDGWAAQMLRWGGELAGWENGWAWIKITIQPKKWKKTEASAVLFPQKATATVQ